MNWPSRAADAEPSPNEVVPKCTSWIYGDGAANGAAVAAPGATSFSCAGGRLYAAIVVLVKMASS